MPVKEIEPGQRPLGRIFRRLFSRVFVVACDMPFFSGTLADWLIDNDVGEEDILVCRTADGRLHPLYGIYAKSCLPVMENDLLSGYCKMARFMEKVRSRTLTAPEEFCRQFTNTNIPEDLQQAEELSIFR